jgi:hypothetical protein
MPLNQHTRGTRIAARDEPAQQPGVGIARIVGRSDHLANSLHDSIHKPPAIHILS